VARIEPGKLGTTVFLTPKSAPFPCDGAAYADSTVIVFVPRHYRAPKGGAIDTVVHFHGHNGTAERVVKTHELREQLYESKQNAILVVPQGPVMAADGNFGKLEKKNGLRHLLSEALNLLASPSVKRALGDAAIPRGARTGLLCLSAHSGGYRATASCLRRGGVNVNEVYLFDALYGEVDAFRDWVLAAKDKRGRDRHKLISHYVGGRVREHNLALMRALSNKGVDCLSETRPGSLSRAEITSARVVFLQSAVTHGEITHLQNNLRDCLFASCLRRQLSSGWFKEKDAPRVIEIRRDS